MSSRNVAVLVAAALLGFAAAAPVAGQMTGNPGALRPASQLTKVEPALANATGAVEVVVRLAGDPVVVANGANSKQFGGRLPAAQQRDVARDLTARQSRVVGQIQALGGTELARVRIAYNAVIVSIDAAQVDSLAAIADVASIRQVRHYETHLGETVPYIGAAGLHAGGLTGAGVRVAVLDSGIDYTHRNLGGAGTLDAYAAAYADPTATAGLFPTDKVVGGFDFVGEQWPNGPRSSDPDPIDFQGHGTHVADIVAGRSADGTHEGVAPDALLYGVKVCSAVASSCNGIALLLGMDFALDPNGDGSMDDAVDVINMSLGSSYGQVEDDLSGASANAVRAGVVVVASAGNSADRPYITGSPAATPEVISVAQTQVPGARRLPLVINSPSNIAGTYPNTETLDWAPLGSGFSGDVAFVGRGCNADPYLANPAGKVALIDRGVCNISEKVARATEAGATAVLIGLVAAGDAVSFSNGGQCPLAGGGACAPSLVITQATANLIKTNIAAPVSVSVSSSVSISLAGSMVGSSARGPNYSFAAIKPDIGAPGASVSAIAGTGTGEEAFGGTSGAAPMVAGAAALLLEQAPNRTPDEIKALLMNSAETQVYTNPATQPGALAPITRIGGGEVRVNRAAALNAIAYDKRTGAASLSFGYRAVTAPVTITRHLEIRNFTGQRRTFSVASGFRYADDAASGAVTVSVPSSVGVPANSSRSIPVSIRIDPAKLPTWTLNGGTQGGNGALLQTVEFDGYLTVEDGSTRATVPWHVLPRRAAAVAAAKGALSLGGGAGTVTLTNTGTQAGVAEVFALTGTSPRIGTSNLPKVGENFAVVDLRSVGVRQVGSTVQFAINTFGERAHPNYPAEFDVYVDSNRDGTPDFVVYNGELSGFAATGQNVVYVLNLTTGAATPFFFADADLNSANAILAAPLAALGLTPGTQFDFAVYAFDNYFTGNLTDAIEGMTFTPNAPRYAASSATVVVPAGGNLAFGVSAPAGGAAASPSQSGLLLMHRSAAPNAEAERISITP